MITKISQAKYLDQSKLLAYHRIEQNDFAHQATSEFFGSCLVGFLLCMLFYRKGDIFLFEKAAFVKVDFPLCLGPVTPITGN